MRLLAVFVAVAACGPGLKPQDPREHANDVMQKASGNADKLASLVRGSVSNGGLWFDSPACVGFNAPAEISGAQQPAFAKCLATLPLQPSKRKDALGDVVVLTYAPGFEVEARIVNEPDGPRLTYIGFVSKRDASDSAPTITPDLLETLRVSGDRTARTSEKEFTWIKLCLDETGTVVAHPHETTSSGGQDATVALVITWKFKPFVVAGQPMPVCSMVRVGDGPPEETIPMPPPPARAGHHAPVILTPGSKLLEGHRIAGEKFIQPDADTKTALRKARITRIVGTFRVCLDEQGHVESVLPLRSTGIAAYDRRILTAISQWAYSPYQIGDQPVPVCTGVTFIYSHH
jgi:hypothetical protein